MVGGVHATSIIILPLIFYAILYPIPMPVSVLVQYFYMLIISNVSYDMRYRLRLLMSLSLLSKSIELATMPFFCLFWWHLDDR